MKILSEKILKNLFSLKEYQSALNIFTYISFEDEVDTQAILKDSSKNIYVPKIFDKNMFFTKYLPEKLVLNKFGIFEPEICNPVLPCETNVIIIPALAVDKKFNRLGYGGGYYDKYLQNVSCIKIVLIPEALLVLEINAESFDISCDIVITEKRIIKKLM